MLIGDDEKSEIVKNHIWNFIKIDFKWKIKLIKIRTKYTYEKALELARNQILW